jgi:hypothetical protein
LAFVGSDSTNQDRILGYGEIYQSQDINSSIIGDGSQFGLVVYEVTTPLPPFVNNPLTPFIKGEGGLLNEVNTFLMKQIQLFVLRIAYCVKTKYAIRDASWLLRPSQQEWDFSYGKCQPNFPEK